jgi:hypothetical protein
MCEGCGLKRPTYGLASEGKRRWCLGCGKAKGAVSLQRKEKAAKKKAAKRPGTESSTRPKKRARAAAAKAEGPTVAEMQAELRRLKLPTGGSKKELQTRLRGLGAEQLLDFRERTMAARAEKDTEEGRPIFAAVWEAQLAKLEQYKHMHGDCDVPQRWAEDPRLGRWVVNQRVLKKKLDGSEASDGMTAERALKLTALGFVWAGSKGKMHRVHPDFGSTLTVSTRDSQSNCWVNWKIMGQPCEF